jgi:aminopeptidase
MDKGARILGEVAFGLNYEIDRFTRNILFDEKIGGTMHLALGSAFTQAGGNNTSGLHWDMICDLREDGEVYADGELVWKAGRFLHEPVPGPAAVETAERA